MSSRTPKILHYCWFGKGKKPVGFNSFLNGWKRNLPDFEIIEWNESNFDINCCRYVREAYDSKKFAFVSDYVRLYALFEFGGVYLDTDVEVCKDLTPLLNIADVTFGFEEKSWVCTSTIIAKPNSPFIKKYIQSYHSRKFILPNGEIDTKTNVQVLTELLVENGLLMNGEGQEFDIKGESVRVLEQKYLSPLDYINRIDNRESSTYTVHHYDISWGKKREFLLKNFKVGLVKLLGKRAAIFLLGLFR